MQNEQELKLTILMPCLNEAETLEVCINKAKTYLETSGVRGEILIADNGSTDGSIEIAARCGARVVNVKEKGYGSALRGGIKDAKGKYVIMGDADDSYDFLHLDAFVEKLDEGYELVMGNRFKGGIEKGAMPFSHRYIGNPVLSKIGKIFYRAPVNDFHCGLRGFNRESILGLNLQTTGMEFASEMVVKASLFKLKACEVPTTLKPDGRTRPPHLRSMRDGWRHLKFLLMYSPDWLFLYPGLFFLILGVASMAILAIFSPIEIGNVGLGMNTMMYSLASILLGYTTISLSIYTKVYARQVGFLPESKAFNRFVDKMTIDKGMLVGAVMFLFGLVGAIASFVLWGRVGFGALTTDFVTRLVIISITLLVLGMQIIFTGFFVGVLKIGKLHQ